MHELDGKTHQKITDLCELADKHCNQDNFESALAKYHEALDLVPEPITDWEASTWILTAIIDTYFFMQNYDKALPVLKHLMHCPGAIGNPFIHLRYGQVAFELDMIEKAKDELARAFMGGAEEIFEDEDPKYLAFIKKYLKT